MSTSPNRAPTSAFGMAVFYIGCAAVGIGAAVAAFVLVMFPGQSFVTPVAIIGSVLVVVGGLAAWRGLHAARRDA